MINHRALEIAKTTRYLLQSIGVDQWTLGELRALAKSNGMTGYRKLSQRELYDILLAKVNADGDPSTSA